MISPFPVIMAASATLLAQASQAKIPNRLAEAAKFLKTANFETNDEKRLLSIFKKANKQILVIWESEDPAVLGVLIDLLDSTNLIYYGHGAKDIAGTLAFDRLRVVVPVTYNITRDEFKNSSESRNKARAIYKEWLETSRLKGNIRFNKDQSRFVSASTTNEEIQQHMKWLFSRK